MDKPIPEAVAQLRRLADVIRRYGTIPPLSLEHIADSLTAAQQQGQADAERRFFAQDFYEEAREGKKPWPGSQPMQQGGGDRKPDGYHYRYPYGNDGWVIRKNGGGEVNGVQPIEAVPYWYAAPPSAPVGVDSIAAEHRALAQQPAAEYEVKFATSARLAKPATTEKCDFCGANPGELHAYDCTALDAQQPAAVDEARWQPIATMPTDDTIVLAKTGDGRVMIYRGSILARNLLGPTPEHLKFPAVKWMQIPGDVE